MIIDISYIIIGLIALIWSAEKFIDGAAAIATHLGMSPLVVGMLIVGFGTSAPEMIVSAFAAFGGNPSIALGNAYGSNIANIGLVLGLTALFYPIAANSRIVRREVPWLLIMLIVSLGFVYDLNLNRIESVIMLLLVVVITILGTLYSGDDDSLKQEINEHQEQQGASDTSLKKSIIWLIIGLSILLLSSHFLVKGAVGVAQYIGISDLIIGLTVVAIGTSLPELAASIIAAKKGESDIILGNIVGSCLFNTLGVVGIAGVIRPLEIEPVFLYRDFSMTILLTLLLWVFAFGIKNTARISRREGGSLLLIYAGYSAYLLATLQIS